MLKKVASIPGSKFEKNLNLENVTLNEIIEISKFNKFFWKGKIKFLKSENFGKIEKIWQFNGKF